MLDDRDNQDTVDRVASGSVLKRTSWQKASASLFRSNPLTI